MRHEICWEHEKKNGGRLVRPQLQRGWYDCLLLFCGTLFCVASAYLQLCEVLTGMRDLVLPEYTLAYVLVAAAVLSVCYGSGVLGRMWLRLLPFFPAALFFLRYYLKHRLQIEDGILYVLRMYVAEICRYYECRILFPVGVEEEAPVALLFWLMLLLIGLFVLAAAVNRMEIMLILPVAVLISGIAVGKLPGWQSMLFLFISALLLRMYRTPSPERLAVRAAQLAGVMGLCVLTSALLSRFADDVIARHDVMMERQLALEDAVLALPVWDLFARDGTVTNDAPLGNGREVLSISLSDAPTENVYLKTYAADHYENGRWSASESAFTEAVTAQGLTVQEAEEEIWNLSREESTKVLKPENTRAAVGNIAIAAPKEYDYTITCKSFGKSAPLPYLSSLPEELTVEGDVAVKKPWTKRNYGGSLMMSGSKLSSLTEYLYDYYWTDMWTIQMVSINDLKTKKNEERVWYADFVLEQYTGASEVVSVEPWLDEYMEFLGWGSAKEIRAYISSVQMEQNESMTNVFRIGYVPMVQAILRDTGSYSRDLEPLPAGEDPVEYFLSTSGEGYCVHFASAATLMLQAMGIPARYASGYVVFPKDFKKTQDDYTAVVTDARAHAWVEVYLEGFGWVPYEVTPGFSDGDASGGETTDADKETGKKEPTKTDTPGTDADKQEEKKTVGDEQDKEKDRAADLTDQLDDSYSELLETKLFGLTFVQWLYILIGLFAVYFSICLLVDGMQFYRRKQEQIIRQELVAGHNRAAILRINRRMYRLLSVRELLIGRRIRDDLRYSRALRWFSAFREAAVDVEQYMILVRQAYFSEHEMRAEDAEIVYDIYLRCRMTKKKRIKISNTAYGRTEHR